MVAAFLVLVTGCTAGPVASGAGSSPSPTSDATPTVQITLDDGDLLDPSQEAAWADPLAGQVGYTVLTTDEGDGSWSYTAEDTGCTIGYWHGPLAETDAASGDSAASDALLAAQFGATPEELGAYADQNAGPFRTPSELVETRAVAGADADAGTTYLIAARAFTALGTGFVATLECPADKNVAVEWAKLGMVQHAFDLVFAAG